MRMFEPVRFKRHEPVICFLEPFRYGGMSQKIVIESVGCHTPLRH